MSKNNSLYDYILSEQNIYNVVYAVESYVFGKGLLSADDIDMYHRLTDKYDFDYIEQVIGRCKTRLESLLQSDELFDITVYFKLKKYDEEKERFDFRPIHTASLTDQICMVCLLQPLMFNDRKGIRQFSELSRLIPHNFYGNLPSRTVDEIFIPWQVKYKEYSERIINMSQECKDKQLYKNEVCLDLKDFFPSINPAYIFHLVREKLRLVYTGVDQAVLEKVLTKLLYFHISPNNLKLWQENYYPNGVVQQTATCTNRGIAQGLPQSYFFGNLMMLDIAKMVEKVFPGKAYYYVDDSVVFTNEVADSVDFQSKIGELNKALAELERQTIENKQEPALRLLKAEDRKAQESISYGIRYHEDGKSFYVSVMDSYSGRGGLQYLTRQVSQAAVFSNNADEIDDTLSLEKLNALQQVIDKELVNEKERLVKLSMRDESQLKLLKRYKKFFLYRQRLLTVREVGFVTNDYLEDFQSRFQLTSERIDPQMLQDTFDEEIFQTECRLIVNWLKERLDQRFIETLSAFELNLANKDGDVLPYLYYTQDLTGTCLHKYRDNVAYLSLVRLFRKHYGTYATAKLETQRNIITFFIVGWWMITRTKLFPAYSHFVLKNSEEFVRKSYNCFFSTIYSVDASDRHSFSKNNNRTLNYTEFRLLAYLRNKQFTKREFDRFAYDLVKAEGTMERMKIDMALMEVLHVLIKNVRNPMFVDNIILTHRLVSGLWKNGSKFLNAYTLHNEDHAITLIKQCVHLLKVIDYLGIKQNDYYVLFLACYLHDISMVIHPNLEDFKLGDIESEKIVSRNMVKFKGLPSNKQEYHDQFRSLLLEAFKDVYSYFENDKRNKHPKDSAAYIKEQHDHFLSYLDDAILEYVALVSESHGYDAADVYGRKSKARNGLFSVKYMMVLIRLADLMDMSNDRVNYYRLRQNLDSLSLTSQFHWISHLITDRAYVTATYEVDDKRRLTQQPITEHMKIKILLNVAYTATLAKKSTCNGCEACHGLESEEKDEDGYSMTKVEVGEKEDTCSCFKTSGCPIICAWMMDKNWWLLNELIELKRYLNQANSRLFNTTMEIDFLYRDTTPLDSDMFDTVRQFLER